MVKHKSATWKPVKLSDAILSSEVEGLAGIEVLTNYNLETFKKNDAKLFNTQVIGDTRVSKNKSRKRKLNSLPDDVPEFKKVKNNKEKVSKLKSEKKSSKTKSKKKKKLTTSEGITAVKHHSDEDGYTIPAGMETWNGLNVPPPILKALAEQGFKEPTEIQALSLPPAIFGRRDILGAAETGSGKTLAFGIPILYGIWLQKMEQEKYDSAERNERLDIEASDVDSGDETSDFESSRLGETEIGCVKVIDNVNFDDEVTEMLPSNAPLKKLYALVLTPTRELAIQVKNHLVAAAKYMDIKVAVVVGGMAPQKQERLLKKGPEIVVATPGRLWELIQEGNPHLSQVDDIRFLAIDETDRMLEKGHFQELQTLLERINMNEGKKRVRQNFVFSATLTLVHEPPSYVKKKVGRKKPTRILPGQKLQSFISMLGITNPKIVDVTKKTGTAETLSEARIFCTLDEKDFYLYYFLQRHPGRTLVFCNSIGCVRRLSQLLNLLKCRAFPLHAEMIQRQRLKNLERFRDEPGSVLLATDVAARGLDIPNVEHVIHYQVPRTSESYVHRSGRTARAQKSGITILLVEPSEMNNYLKLCRTLGRDEDLPEFPTLSDYMGSVKERVILAREIDKLELTSRKSNAETGWIKKALTQMDMVIDDSELPRNADHEKVSKYKKLSVIKRKQLEVLLSRPVFPRGLSLQPEESLATCQETHSDAIEVLESTISESKIAKKQKKKKPHVPGKFIQINLSMKRRNRKKKKNEQNTGT